MGEEEEDDLEAAIKSTADSEKKEEKKKKKKDAKKKQKLRERIAMKMVHVGDKFDETRDDEVFDLKRLSMGDKGLKRVVGDDDDDKKGGRKEADAVEMPDVEDSEDSEEEEPLPMKKKLVSFKKNDDDDDDDDDGEAPSLIEKKNMKYMGDKIANETVDSDEEDSVDDMDHDSDVDVDDDDEDVEDGCTGAWHVQSGVVAGAAYSYDMCGAPDCSVDAWDDALCPAGVGGEHDHEKTCHCLFEGTTLPEESAAYYGNPLYGTNCEEEWDEMPGTENYAAGKTENCFGAEGEECTKECNWRHARWCFVEKGCNGLEKDEVVVVDANKQDNLKKGVQLTKPSFLGKVGYSYAMCHYADCYGDNFDDNPECPFGEKCLTCGMVKCNFKTGGCCGHPEKHIIIHHLYHDLGEFPHHHHFPHDDDTHGHR